MTGDDGSDVESVDGSYWDREATAVLEGGVRELMALAAAARIGAKASPDDPRHDGIRLIGERFADGMRDGLDEDRLFEDAEAGLVATAYDDPEDLLVVDVAVDDRRDG